MTVIDIAHLPAGREKARQYAIVGLLNDGAHHKQWALEQVLLALEEDLDSLRDVLSGEGYSWEAGIAP